MCKLENQKVSQEKTKTIDTLNNNGVQWNSKVLKQIKELNYG